MDESTGECDNTVVAADAVKNHLVNGVSVNASYGAEGMDHNGGDVVGDERKEDIAADIKDATQSMKSFYTITAVFTLRAQHSVNSVVKFRFVCL
jgi:hypothetical protein